MSEKAEMEVEEKLVLTEEELERINKGLQREIDQSTINALLIVAIGLILSNSGFHIETLTEQQIAQIVSTYIEEETKSGVPLDEIMESVKVVIKLSRENKIFLYGVGYTLREWINILTDPIEGIPYVGSILHSIISIIRSSIGIIFNNVGFVNLRLKETASVFKDAELTENTRELNWKSLRYFLELEVVQVGLIILLGIMLWNVPGKLNSAAKAVAAVPKFHYKLQKKHIQ